MKSTKVFRVLSLFLVYIFLVNPIEAKAITIDNDGNAKDVPYGDSGLPSSFTSGDYYDCYLPYNLTPAEIGGYSDGVIAYSTATYNYSMVSAYSGRINKKFTNSINHYKSLTGTYKNCALSTEANTNIGIITDANGGQYYMTAIQNFFYRFPAVEMAGSTFPGWDMSNRGQIFDVILTDGTCIHFCVVDANAVPHTNGGPKEETLKDVQYTFTPVNLPQYINIYHAAFGNTIELVGSKGCSTSFASKFNMSDSGNQIAYYRMYNFTIQNAPARADGVGNEPSYSMGNATISSSSNSSGGSNNGSGTVAVSSSKLVKEWELQGMPTESEIKKRQKQIYLPSREDLTISEAYTVALIKDDLSIINKAKLLDKTRVASAFLGLILIVYSVLLIMAMLFDRVNVFLDFSLVSLMTLGNLKYSPYESDCTNRKGISNTTKLVISSVVVLVIGLVILSGSIFNYMGSIVYWVSQKLY